MKRQHGMSLVELMVALLISTILTLGVLQLFDSTSASDRTNTAIARVQENGRVALEIIGGDARRTGYQGCSSAANSLTVNGVTFPDQALQASSKSITFNYASTEVTANSFSANKTCDNKSLYLKSVTYGQCSNGTSICMNNEPILDNTTITRIYFGITDAGSTKWVESASVTATDLAMANSVSITLEIKEPRNEVTRTFSNTYELRNRF